MTFKNIIGKQRIRNYEIGDTDELLRRAELHVEPLKEKERKQKSNELENKVPIPTFQPSEDLMFITDVNLYKEIIKYLDKTFSSQKADISDKLFFDNFNNVMKGSNTYIATAVDMYLNSINSEYRLATQLDLEQNLNFTEGTYNDSGLALRNLKGANKTQAEYLFNQLKKRGLTDKDLPIWLNLRDLVLDNNLNFNLTNKSLYKTAECLNWDGGNKFSKTDNFGLPKEKDDNSPRQIWTNKSYALSRCYLCMNSSLSSSNSDLSISIDVGRVVLAKVRKS